VPYCGNDSLASSDARAQTKEAPDVLRSCGTQPANISLITVDISSVVCCLHLSEGPRTRRANEEKEEGCGKDLDRSNHINAEVLERASGSARRSARQCPAGTERRSSDP
jgi:hypothetical protein